MKADKRRPTTLDIARQSEIRARAALEAARIAFKQAKAAYDAIGVVVAELEGCPRR